MDTLPIELVCQILRFLSPLEFKKVAPVCRQFNQALDILWGTNEFKFREKPAYFELLKEALSATCILYRYPASFLDDPVCVKELIKKQWAIFTLIKPSILDIPAVNNILIVSYVKAKGAKPMPPPIPAEYSYWDGIKPLTLPHPETSFYYTLLPTNWEIRSPPYDAFRFIIDNYRPQQVIPEKQIINQKLAPFFNANVSYKTGERNPLWKGLFNFCEVNITFFKQQTRLHGIICEKYDELSREIDVENLRWITEKTCRPNCLRRLLLEDEILNSDYWYKSMNALRQFVQRSRGTDDLSFALDALSHCDYSLFI